MAAGHIVNGSCVDVAASADLYYSVQSSRIEKGTSLDFYHQHSKNAGAWQVEQYSIASDGSVVLLHQASIPIPNFATCDYQPEDSAFDRFVDGSVLGWGIVAAMVAAWLFLQMRRAL
jgi:hypothetical protein